MLCRLDNVRSLVQSTRRDERGQRHLGVVDVLVGHGIFHVLERLEHGRVLQRRRDDDRADVVLEREVLYPLSRGGLTHLDNVNTVTTMRRNEITHTLLPKVGRSKHDASLWQLIRTDLMLVKETKHGLEHALVGLTQLVNHDKHRLVGPEPQLLVGHEGHDTTAIDGVQLRNRHVTCLLGGTVIVELTRGRDADLLTHDTDHGGLARTDVTLHNNSHA